MSERIERVSRLRMLKKPSFRVERSLETLSIPKYAPKMP